MQRTVTIIAIFFLWLAGTAGALDVGPLPADAPTGFDQYFTKHVDVLGVHFFASSSTPDDKLLHGAAVLAQYLDNDEDGLPDNSAVVAALVARNGSMLMWATEQEFESSGFDGGISDQVFDTTSMQLLFAAETNPGYPGNGVFDWALEECLHLVTFGGYALAHPSVFGEYSGTQLANAMDSNISNGYFHYADPTCDYECKISEYFYWGLTSYLGAQDFNWRISDITEEWELYTAALMTQNDPLLTNLITNPGWALPTVLPDGIYDPDNETIFLDGFDDGSDAAWTH